MNRQLSRRLLAAVGTVTSGGYSPEAQKLQGLDFPRHSGKPQCTSLRDWGKALGWVAYFVHVKAFMSS